MTSLGFIGLGIMGGRIVKRLLAAGYEVSGYNRTPGKADALVSAGMRLCATPREVVQAADITFSMVADNNALKSVTDGPDGVLAGLTNRKIYIDMSTVSPHLIRDLAQRVTAAGAWMLDAPVSGSVAAVEGGTLVFYVGGDAKVVAHVRPVFEALGQKVIHVGGNGQGIATKIAINLSLPIQLIALYEGVLMIERSGISREAALDSLLNSVAASPAMKYRAPFILKMPDEVWFNIAMMKKDVELALEMGSELHVPLESVQLSHKILLKAIDMGYAEMDFAAMFNVLLKEAE